MYFVDLNRIPVICLVLVATCTRGFLIPKTDSPIHSSSVTPQPLITTTATKDSSRLFTNKIISTSGFLSHLQRKSTLSVVILGDKVAVQSEKLDERLHVLEILINYTLQKIVSTMYHIFIKKLVAF